MDGKFEGKVQFLKAKAVHVNKVFGRVISHAHHPPPKFLSISFRKYTAIDDRHVKSVVFSAFLK